MADLHSVDLRGADLSKSDLRQTDLREADLRGANLNEATLIWGDTTIDNVFSGNFTGTKYNNSTTFPANFDPTKWGMIFQD